MAKQTQDNTRVAPVVTTNANTVVAPKVVASKSKIEEFTYMFTKQNYMIMIGGLVLITLGFILMAGGRSADPNVFDPKEIYSTRRITVAPILVMLGFIVEIVAILWMPKEEAAA